MRVLTLTAATALTFSAVRVALMSLLRLFPLRATLLVLKIPTRSKMANVVAILATHPQTVVCAFLLPGAAFLKRGRLHVVRANACSFLSLPKRRLAV